VAPEQAGLRLDRFLQHCIPRLSRTRANEIVRACARHPDGKRRRPSERVRADEIVLIVRPPMNEPETPQEFEVVYEDEAVVVVDKPAGLPIHPTATYHKNTLTWLLRDRFGSPSPQPAHRLDRETSGLVVCGRTPEAEKALKRAFEERRVHKRYLAVVRGELPEERGRIEVPMAPAREGPHVMMEVREEGEGLPAATVYEVVDRRPGLTLVSLWPETGRQHQLRVHLAHLGHPIVADKLYGPEGPAPFLEHIETGHTPELEARLGHGRQALHAHELELPHPSSGESLRLRAELPEDLRRLWDRGLVSSRG